MPGQGSAHRQEVVPFPGRRVPPAGKSAPAPHAAAPVRDAGRGVAVARLLILSLLAFLILANFLGLPYYRLPTEERVRSALHPWFKPTGIIGQSAGIAAFVLFMALWLYPLRKKFRGLAFTGPVSRWLDVHVMMGLSIPFIAAVHAAWHFTGLIGLGYGAMLVAWMSGILGRYIYTRIPRSRNGLELTLEEVNARRDSFLDRIATATGLERDLIEHVLSPDPSPTAGLGPVRTILRMISDDFGRWRASRRFRAEWRGFARGEEPVDPEVFREVLRLARKEMALSQQIRMLDASRRIFQYWHVAHRPMAISALVAVVLHVAIAVLLGVTWFW